MCRCSHSDHTNLDGSKRCTPRLGTGFPSSPLSRMSCTSQVNPRMSQSRGNAHLAESNGPVTLSRALPLRDRHLFREPPGSTIRSASPFHRPLQTSKADGTQNARRSGRLTKSARKGTNQPVNGLADKWQLSLGKALHQSQPLACRAGRASGQNDFASAGAALALPLVILAQFLLVLFHLSFQVAECFLAACAHRGGFAGGAQGP